MIKIFVRAVQSAEYVSVPADGFRLTGTYIASRSSGRDGDDGPMSEEMAYAFTFPLNSSPDGVYQMLYSQIIADCKANGWEIPTKTDIYGWIPLSFDMLGVQ